MGYASLTRHLQATPEAVWAYVTDTERLTTWVTLFGGVFSNDPSLGTVGAKFDAAMVVGHEDVGSIWEVTKAEAPRLLHLHGSDSHGSAIDVWLGIGAWEDGSEFELEVAYDLGGGLLAGLADRMVVERRVGRELRRSLDRLAERLHVT